MIVLAVLPPTAGIFWWYVTRAGNPIVGIPLALTFAALAAVVIIWLCELADYFGRVTGGKRQG